MSIREIIQKVTNGFWWKILRYGSGLRNNPFDFGGDLMDRDLDPEFLDLQIQEVFKGSLFTNQIPIDSQD